MKNTGWGIFHGDVILEKIGYAFVYSRVGVGEIDNIIGSLSAE